jgi:hypothetical protein
MTTPRPPRARGAAAHARSPHTPHDTDRSDDPPGAPAAQQGSTRIMANTETALKDAMTSIEGVIGVALVDYTSGMALGTLGGGKELDLNVAAAGNTDVVRAKVRTMELLGLKDEIEDILITLGNQYHLIRLLKGRGKSGLFLYLALDKNRANLAMARHQLRSIETDLEV